MSVKWIISGSFKDLPTFKVADDMWLDLNNPTGTFEDGDDLMWEIADAALEFLGCNFEFVPGGVARVRARYMRRTGAIHIDWECDDGKWIHAGCCIWCGLELPSEAAPLVGAGQSGEPQRWINGTEDAQAADLVETARRSLRRQVTDPYFLEALHELQREEPELFELTARQRNRKRGRPLMKVAERKKLDSELAFALTAMKVGISKNLTKIAEVYVANSNPQMNPISRRTEAKKVAQRWRDHIKRKKKSA